MTRILADLPDDDIKWLDQLADEQGKSRAQILRDAVAAYRAYAPAGAKNSWIERGAGLWQDRSDVPEGVAYQRLTRGAPRSGREG